MIPTRPLTSDPQRKGVGVPFDKIDPRVAVPACESAVRQSPNDGRLIFQLGRAYQKANNFAGAIYQYRRAAEQGFALAQSNLGKMYQDGLGVPKDLGQAVAWYRKAAEQGFAAAHSNLGVMYQNGWGVPKNFGQAVAWYRKAAEQGFAAAHSNLGVMYQNGSGVPKNFGQAVAWYRKAAEQGFAAAHSNLGVMYQNGWGVPKDFGQAIALYRKAADQGIAAAQNNLGFLYQNGLGVPKDLQQAIAWYRKATEQGLADAQTNLKQLSPGEYNQAIERAQIRAESQAAKADAEAEQAKVQQAAVEAEREKARAKQAEADAEKAKAQAQQAKAEADRAKAEADQAKVQTSWAEAEAEQAKADRAKAEAAKRAADEETQRQADEAETYKRQTDDQQGQKTQSAATGKAHADGLDIKGYRLGMSLDDLQREWDGCHIQGEIGMFMCRGWAQEYGYGGGDGFVFYYSTGLEPKVWKISYNLSGQSCSSLISEVQKKYGVGEPSQTKTGVTYWKVGKETLGLAPTIMGIRGCHLFILDAAAPLNDLQKQYQDCIWNYSGPNAITDFFRAPPSGSPSEQATEQVRRDRANPQRFRSC